MKLQLDIQTIVAQSAVAQKLLIKVIINDSIDFKTDWAQRKKDNIFPFFQKNIINVPQNELHYLKLQIRNQSKYLVAEKTVLNQQARNNTQIQFMIGKAKIRLKYKLIETVNDQLQQSISLNKKTSIEDQPEILKSSDGKLQILKLGSYVYNFSQRLDPLIWLANQAIDILSWRSPGLTIGVGIFLTLVIMNLRISLLFSMIFLIFGKGYLIKKIQKMNKKWNFHKRIWVPKQNTVFLQNSMTNYNLVYQKIHQYCLTQDKTKVINLINHICQASFFIFILLFVVSLEKIIVVALWAVLMLCSPSGISYFKQIWPSFLYFQKQTQKVTGTLASYLKIAMGKSEEQQKQVIKQFYFYEYQRWFMGKGWTKPIGLLQFHFADESAKIQLVPKIIPPDGWEWLTDHQIQYVQNADHHGYQYTNDLTKNFSPACNFATLRRRKFIRKCKTISERPKQTAVNIVSNRKIQ